MRNGQTDPHECSNTKKNKKLDLELYFVLSEKCRSMAKKALFLNQKKEIHLKTNKKLYFYD